MPPSLLSKLRVMRRSLKSEVKPYMLIDFDHLKLVARHMPTTNDELVKLIPESFVSAYGEKILAVTTQHSRDKERFEDCVEEIKAFARGGLPGMARLELVYTQILKEFDMQDETEEILYACKLYIHPEQKCLKRKRPEISEELCEFQHASQM